MVNARIQQWIQQNYPSPTMDIEWLEPCCEHIKGENHLDPDNPAHFDRFVEQVEFHLLNNALQDSMVPETGLPIIPARGEMTITGPILVEVRAIMEVGHSAYDLWRVRAARQERGVVRLSERDDEQQEEGQEDEDEGPIPKYPRGMLDLVLTDGSRSLKAMEYRFIPEIVLGETRLGYKMIIKDVYVRDGIAFLQNENITHKGQYTPGYEENQDEEFAAALRRAMGWEEGADGPPHMNGRPAAAVNRPPNSNTRPPNSAASRPPDSNARPPSSVASRPPNSSTSITGRPPESAPNNRPPVSTTSVASTPTRTVQQPHQSTYFEQYDRRYGNTDRGAASVLDISFSPTREAIDLDTSIDEVRETSTSTRANNVRPADSGAKQAVAKASGSGTTSRGGDEAAAGKVRHRPSTGVIKPHYNDRQKRLAQAIGVPTEEQKRAEMTARRSRAAPAAAAAAGAGAGATAGSSSTNRTREAPARQATDLNESNDMDIEMAVAWEEEMDQDTADTTRDANATANATKNATANTSAGGGGDNSSDYFDDDMDADDFAALDQIEQQGAPAPQAGPSRGGADNGRASRSSGRRSTTASTGDMILIDSDGDDDGEERRGRRGSANIAKRRKVEPRQSVIDISDSD